jgi:hypothetical protein
MQKFVSWYPSCILFKKDFNKFIRPNKYSLWFQLFDLFADWRCGCGPIFQHFCLTHWQGAIKFSLLINTNTVICKLKGVQGKEEM